MPKQPKPTQPPMAEAVAPIAEAQAPTVEQVPQTQAAPAPAAAPLTLEQLIEREDALRIARAEMAQRLREQIANLNAQLGRLELAQIAPTSTKPSHSSSGGNNSLMASDKVCPICNIKGHDVRMHRGQAVKQPFTAAQLAEMRAASELRRRWRKP